MFYPIYVPRHATTQRKQPTTEVRGSLVGNIVIYRHLFFPFLSVGSVSSSATADRFNLTDCSKLRYYEPRAPEQPNTDWNEAVLIAFQYKFTVYIVFDCVFCWRHSFDYVDTIPSLKITLIYFILKGKFYFYQTTKWTSCNATSLIRIHSTILWYNNMVFIIYSIINLSIIL